MQFETMRHQLLDSSFLAFDISRESRFFRHYSIEFDVQIVGFGCVAGRSRLWRGEGFIEKASKSTLSYYDFPAVERRLPHT